MTTGDDMEFHRYANHFPLMEGEEFRDLVEDITENGLLESIVVHDSKILDGRNRYRACLEAGVEPEFREYEGESPISYVISMNARRRHLNPAQVALAVRELKGEYLREQERDEETGQFKPLPPADGDGTSWSGRAASDAGIGRSTLERVDRVAREAENPDSPHRGEAEEMVEEIRRGEMGAKTAEKRLKRLKRQREEQKRETRKTDEERRQEAASEALQTTVKKGKAYRDALHTLFEHHGDYIGREAALNLAKTLTEIRGIIASGFSDNQLRLDGNGEGRFDDALEVEHEFVE